ncbi:hypothetical protein O3M35_009413 [Rhynocoris fuscipes]|uniref:Uncharacterized protein n=1 Tax=Rhynocoris fuscipes TaxID=488301 RepID=A0AAW1D8S1_9HEMI
MRIYHYQVNIEYSRRYRDQLFVMQHRYGDIINTLRWKNCRNILLKNCFSYPEIRRITFFIYILYKKTLMNPNPVLKKRLALVIMNKKIGWFAEVSGLCEKHHIRVDDIYCGLDHSLINELLASLQVEFQNDIIVQRDQARFHNIYKQLNLKVNYMTKDILCVS